MWLLLPSATILISVTHVYKVWLTFPSLTHLAKCDPFCPVWLLLQGATILISVTHFIDCDSSSLWVKLGQMWPILRSVTPTSKCDNFDKCDPFYRVWLTFPSLTHLAKCDPFCPVWLVLPRATILISVTQFIDCDSSSLWVKVGQMWPILRSVTPTSKCDNFDKYDPFYRVWLTFPSLTHLAKCDPFCPVWLLLPSAIILISVTHVYRVTHLLKFDPFG